MPHFPEDVPLAFSFLSSQTHSQSFYAYYYYYIIYDYIIFSLVRLASCVINHLLDKLISDRGCIYLEYMLICALEEIFLIRIPLLLTNIQNVNTRNVSIVAHVGCIKLVKTILTLQWL